MLTLSLTLTLASLPGWQPKEHKRWEHRELLEIVSVILCLETRIFPSAEKPFPCAVALVGLGRALGEVGRDPPWGLSAQKNWKHISESGNSWNLSECPCLCPCHAVCCSHMFSLGSLLLCTGKEQDRNVWNVSAVSNTAHTSTICFQVVLEMMELCMLELSSAKTKINNSGFWLF